MKNGKSIALLSLLALVIQGCVSYEPRLITPSITFSPEQVSLGATLTPEGAIEFGLEVTPNESDSLFNVEVLPGVRVRQIAAGSAADSAGIQVGDVILRIDGLAINHPDTLEALQQTPRENLNYAVVARRNTTVFEATMTARVRQSQSAPKELYRIDPIASRAGYSTRLIDIDNRQGLAAAEIVEFFEQSPLPAAGLKTGDIVFMLEGREINSAQDLVNRLNQDFNVGDKVSMTIYRDQKIFDETITLWNPGRRISRISLGPLLNYQASLSPTSKQFSLLDLWLFSVYSYRRVEGEKSHSFLGLINYSSDLGELTEE